MGKNISGLEWFAHSIMLYKTQSITAQIRWKMSKTKRNDSMEMRLILHISIWRLVVRFYCCCFTAALPTVSRNTIQMKTWKYWKYFTRKHIILKIRCKCIEGGICKRMGILTSLIIIVTSRNAMNNLLLLCISSALCIEWYSNWMLWIVEEAQCFLRKIVRKVFSLNCIFHLM